MSASGPDLKHDMNKKSITEIQKEITEEFNTCRSGFDQYELLIKTARQLLPFTSEARKIARIVQGCQSQVWLSIQCKNGIFEFCGYSNSSIINGVIALLERMFCGQSCSAVAAAEITFLKDTAFLTVFESERAKGIQYMIKSLQEEALRSVTSF